MQRVPDRACLRTKPVLASSHLSLDGMIPTSTTASTSPLHQRLFLSSLAKPAISCQLHATSAPFRVRTFHLPRHQQHLFTSAQKKTRPAPHAPRRNKRVKQHCPRGKCTLWWSALLVYSRSLPLSDFKNCVLYQKKPSPTE
jgi:hypothetical protein